MLIAAVLATSNEAWGADQIFSDEAAFLAAAGVPLRIESFETLPLDTGITQSSLVLGDVSLVSQANRLGVRDVAIPGKDRSQFVIYAQEDNSTLTFSFASPRSGGHAG